VIDPSADRRIRSLRPPKPLVDPWQAHGFVVEDERRPTRASAHGGPPDGIRASIRETTVTVFLAGAECAFTCSFCDLWRYTMDGPTPVGAIPRQLDEVLGQLPTPRPARIKLYNASNFFDRRAVPDVDLPAIAERCAAFAGVTVESHASTVGVRTLDVARRIPGRLEVALGLETVHPAAMRTMNKRLDMDRFDRAADFLAAHDIDLRVFVLLGAPGVPHDESVEWTVRTVEHAAARGAAMVAIIPVRGGNGELERLQALGQFTPPTLTQLEQALEACASIGSAAVLVDLWDAELLTDDQGDRAARIGRLRRLNLEGAGAATAGHAEAMHD
jgi:radical SAM enzyme (TIGR01210 family)